MRNTFILFTFIFSFLHAIGTWMFNQRTHPELTWQTLETENFNVHYHNGIKEIALQGASIAEQIRPTLIKQMGLDTLPEMDIVFTTEDEVFNGFAMSGNRTIIWVDQNDASLWTGDEKWLRTVLAHELQHLVYFNAIKGPRWLPSPMDMLFSNIPPWVSEGLAEYYTEKWRPFRFDISHKGHVIRNTVHKIKDPHNDGFSKSLYLADRFGDSTIIKILNHRNKAGLLIFDESFKKHTGIKLKQFNEDWRRHMNTFYFGQRSQKERIEEIGEVSKLPVKRVAAFDYFNDTLKIAMIGQMSKGQGDLSLIVATRDTSKERKARKKALEKAEKKEEKPKKIKPKWKLKEWDSGIFGERIINFDVSPDNGSIIYPKYRYGGKQSLMFDIWKLDLKTKKKTLLTQSMRANYPKFSPDGTEIIFVAHGNSLSQLYLMDSDGANIKQITENVGDTQIITPAWSPDGSSIAYAQSDPDGSMDIHILELESRKIVQITESSEADYWPIWHPEGTKISFTGLYDFTPNLYTYDFETTQTIQNTDVGDIVIGAQWNNKSNTIIASTLRTVDSSRIVSIDPSRSVDKKEISMNKSFSSWRSKSPDNPIINIDPLKPVVINNESAYKPIKNIAHIGTIVLPDDNSFFLNTAFTDVIGRHMVEVLYATDYQLHSYVFSYQNFKGLPFIGGFWGMNYFKDINFQFQFYNKDQSLLLESFNGFSFWGRFPYNFGKSLSANHNLIYSIQLLNREAYFDSTNFSSNIFEEPESGEEGSINLSYTFVNKRSHLKNLYSPDQGFGLELSIKNADKSIWGDFDYLKTEVDFYVNKKAGPFSVFSRGRYETIEGSPPSQEQIGIVNIPNYYFGGSITPGREYMSPRGYSGSQLGNQAFMGTVELRAPVLPLNIIEVLKIIQFGRPTFALFSDFGRITDSKEELILTTGAELRFSILLANSPLFMFSYGWAQTPGQWSEDWNKINDPGYDQSIEIGPKPYFQMTLINPF